MRKSTLSLAFLISTLALTGCGRNPVAPQGVVPTDPSASSARGTQSEDPIPDIVGEGGANGALHVASQEAGTLTVGRWTLTIHKNSHIDASTIALTVRDPNSMEVEIEVTPASANNFQVPIELVANCSDQPGMVMNDNAIFVWNEGWEQAADQNTQDGSMIIKAKMNQLKNAKVAAKATAETVRGKH